MSSFLASRTSSRGGFRPRGGRTSVATSEINAKQKRLRWRSDTKTIYLRNEVHSTWKHLKNAGTFVSDSTFAAYLLSLEIKRQERYGKIVLGDTKNNSCLLSDWYSECNILDYFFTLLGSRSIMLWSDRQGQRMCDQRSRNGGNSATMLIPQV